MTENGKVCGLCGKSEVFAACSRCGIEACEKCMRYELIISGCCFISPAYYCINCISASVHDKKAAPGAQER
ncbi:MAG: hypothetical protein ABFD82_23770 [Syntrophaceae bacterium]